jgi:hypothetical protein
MHQALMDASVATEKASYADGDRVVITMTVADGVGAVGGVTVRLLLTVPNGAALAGNSITSEEGVATISHRVDAAGGGTGMCVLEAVASRRGFESVTAVASFQVSG